jgi:hypothetical protein
MEELAVFHPVYTAHLEWEVQLPVLWNSSAMLFVIPQSKFLKDLNKGLFQSLLSASSENQKNMKMNL